MGRDNHNAGLHYKEFARDHTALHEFDYDNEVGSRQKKNSNVIKRNEMQTAVFSTKGNLIYHDQSYWAAERKSALEEYNVRKNRQKREREMERDEKAKKGEAKHKSKVGKGTKKSVLKVQYLKNMKQKRLELK